MGNYQGAEQNSSHLNSKNYQLQMILDKVKLGEAAAIRQSIISPSKVQHTKNMSILDKIKNGQKIKINGEFINKVSGDDGFRKGSTNSFA